MKFYGSNHLWSFILPCFLLAIDQAGGATMTIGPSADTTLFQEQPDYNMGAVPSMIGGKTAHNTRNRALVKFEVAENLPSNAIVESANLIVEVVAVHSAFGVNSTFDLHRVLQDWGEGGKTDGAKLGQLATAGEATWNSRLHGTSLWGAPGAEEGTDYLAIESSSQLISGLGSYTFASTTNLVADVQLWLTNAANNFGWILISRSEDVVFTARRFASREETASPPPRLVIQYSVAPQTPRIDLIERGTTNVNVHFMVEGTYCYDVEVRESLSGGEWSTLTNVCAAVSSRNVVISDPLAAAGQRFYRLRVTGQAP